MATSKPRRRARRRRPRMRWVAAGAVVILIGAGLPLARMAMDGPDRVGADPGVSPAATGAPCASGVPGDVNGDGHAEVAVGEWSGKDRAGAVHVLYGQSSGLVAEATGTAPADQYFTASSSGQSAERQPLAYFGSDLAFGDFDHDGCADLVIGAQGAVDNTGSLTVLYGSPAGLTTSRVQQLTAVTLGAGLRSLDHSLVVADLDDDGTDDLAFGALLEKGSAGAVVVLQGGSKGLAMTGPEVITSASLGGSSPTGAADRFGQALATGDFDGNGRAELAIATVAKNGRVQTVEGGPDGFRGASVRTVEARGPGVPRPQESYVDFGSALAAGDVDGDGRDDLAVGMSALACRTECDVPDQEEGDGAVLVLPGTAKGLTAVGSRLWTQDSPGVAGQATHELFGAALAMGRLDDGPTDDLVIGAPADDPGGADAAGSVTVLLGSPSGLSAPAGGGERIQQGLPGIRGKNEPGDGFGGALSTAYVQRRDRANVVVGSSGEDVSTTVDAGRVYLIATSPAGPVSRGSQTLDGSAPGVVGGAVDLGRLGAAVG